ncbi:MAG: hypothetical protein V4717_21165 [Bacteroidota bacterium]
MKKLSRISSEFPCIAIPASDLYETANDGVYLEWKIAYLEFR